MEKRPYEWFLFLPVMDYNEIRKYSLLIYQDRRLRWWPQTLPVVWAAAAAISVQGWPHAQDKANFPPF